MKNLKNLFQNQKGLQKLDTKHISLAPKKDFQKKENFWVFSKKGGWGGQKNDFFGNIFPKSKRASKIGYETVATIPKRRNFFSLSVTDRILKFRYRFSAKIYIFIFLYWFLQPNR